MTGQHRARDLHQPQEVVVPVEGVDVEQERARGVRDVGRVDAALGQAPGQPAVDGPERELAALGAAAEAALLEDVPDLRAGEVGVDRQARALADERLVTVRAQPFAERGGDPALPDDRRGDGPAGGAVPHDGGLALVGDADRDDVLRPADRRDDLPRDGELARPDVVGVVGDVARATGTPAGTRAGRWRPACPSGRRRWRATTWCPGPARGRRGRSVMPARRTRDGRRRGRPRPRGRTGRRPSRGSGHDRGHPGAIDAPRSRSSGREADPADEDVLERLRQLALDGPGRPLPRGTASRRRGADPRRRHRASPAASTARASVPWRSTSERAAPCEIPRRWRHASRARPARRAAPRRSSAAPRSGSAAAWPRSAPSAASTASRAITR